MQSAKVGEILGQPTVGYGESKVKAYCDLKDRTYEIRLYRDKTHCGSILFETLEQFLAVLVELRKGFRIVR